MHLCVGGQILPNDLAGTEREGAGDPPSLHGNLYNGVGSWQGTRAEQAVENRERTEARVEAGTAIARLQTLCKGAISNLLWTQSQCSPALLRELEEAPGP